MSRNIQVKSGMVTNTYQSNFPAWSSYNPFTAYKNEDNRNKKLINLETMFEVDVLNIYIFFRKDL